MTLRQQLITAVEQIPGVEDKPSPVSGGSSLFFHDQEFAHFHHDNELDIRLTRKIIKREGLSHPPGSVHHPQRSPNSAWIELRFDQESHIDDIARLVKVATEQL